MILTAALSAALAGAGRAALSAAPEVQAYGAMHAIAHEGRIDRQIDLDSLPDSASLLGLGALEGLAGEILLYGGDIILAHAGGVVQKVARPSGAGAALLVVSDVDAWETLSLPDSIAWDNLDAAIERQIAQSGRDVQKRVPFQLVGRFARLSWHVVDGSRLPAGGSTHEDHRNASDRLSAHDVAARLVGFFSVNDAGVFTHAGSRTHLHCLLESPLRMGHVDEVLVPAGTKLLLPRQDDAEASAIIERMLQFLGTDVARQAIRSLRTEADCMGPGGSFRTVVRSVLPDRVQFEQESERGTSVLWSLPARTWSRNAEGQVHDAPAMARGFVRGHEFHLQLLQVRQRFAGYRLHGVETINGEQAWRIDMRDEDGHPASLWVRQEDAMPLQLEVHPPGATGAVRVQYHVWRERDGVQWFRGFELTEGTDRVFHYRYTHIQPNDVAAEVFLHPGETPLQGLRTVVVGVPDIHRARDWYARALRIEPYFEESFYVGFNVGGYELGLDPDAPAADPDKPGVIAYWGVEDVAAEVERLVGLGATELQPVSEVGGGILVATVRDPFGNPFGLIHNPHFTLEDTGVE